MGYAKVTSSNILIEISNASLLLMDGSANKLIQLQINR